MASEKGYRKEKDKNQNIQVFVRLRPLNQRERDIKSLGVVEVVNGREVVIRQSQQTCLTKRFTFDRAFPPSSKQVEVYQEVVSPLIEEVLQGYNCTVFAYGQTGTGKTHTMVGENSGNETTWQSDPLAGIIPRALSQLFDELRISNTEYTVRVSYLELYNEELFDLLSSSEDNSKLRIYEDVTRKGSNIVNGLEEITVYNKTEVYKIMAQGQERKKVASTLMNAQSSRSHTVFTIVVHMKENSPEGEELVKIGKLNLVDLAGSENISKAGSDNPAKRERARECVNINQSLLTLGRVITALVERHPHIPYRESKLTRILQESLGGRTKTSIIATISPGHKDLEETMSTLEYANRAKNIQNKPEVNQKMTKKAILKEYAEEIDRLKRDLQAARDKNGVFLANETFAEMTMKQEEQRKEIQELLLKKRAMEEERDRMQNVFEELGQQLRQREEQLAHTVNQLGATKNDLANTCNILNTTKLHYEESQHLVSKQQATERALSAQAKDLLAVADAATNDATRLHDTVDKRRSVESTNLEITQNYRALSAQHRAGITGGLERYVASLTDCLGLMQTALDNFTKDSTQSCTETTQSLDQLAQLSMKMVQEISELKCEAERAMSAEMEERRAGLAQALGQRGESVRSLLTAFAECVRECVRRARDVDVRTDLERFLTTWHAEISSKLSTLRSMQAGLRSRLVEAGGRRQDAARALTAAARDRAGARRRDVTDRIELIKANKEDYDRRFAQEMREIESDRAEAERRLEEWVAEERRLFEERIEKHVKSEQKALEERLKCWIQRVEEQRRSFENTTSMHLEWLHSQLEEIDTTLQLADDNLKQNIKEVEDNMTEVKQFADNCETSCDAITSDVDNLSGNTLLVAETVANNLLNDLQQTTQYVEEQSSMFIEKNTDSNKELTEDVDNLLAVLKQHCDNAVARVATRVNETSQSVIQQISSLSASTSSLATAVSAHQQTQLDALSSSQRDLQVLYDAVRGEVAQLAELEGRCLSQEYAVYSPTGRTPVRRVYRYPRELVATSPHERILARFRALRHNSHDDDCIVVEGDGEGEQESRSDTDSSLSEDSAVAFAAPSPPTDPVRPPHIQPIVKSTSETDIYHKRRHEQPGKENVNRSMSFKKPSKLPAPASTKKPLIVRNDN